METWTRRNADKPGVPFDAQALKEHIVPLWGGLIPTELTQNSRKNEIKQPTKNKTVDRMIALSVLGFWDKNTMACAGAMPCRRDFPATTRILSFQAKNGMILPTFCSWWGTDVPRYGGAQSAEQAVI